MLGMVEWQTNIISFHIFVITRLVARIIIIEKANVYKR